jgi:prepilin-type N-terminal cleavage/methylation domain-containing protein
MPKVWFRTSRISQAGFSVVEVLLAVTVFGMLATAVIGALVYGRASTVDSGDATRGNYLAEEGTEAVRNIRNAGYANLTDGTYGLVQSGNTWTLSGSSDTSGIYNRSVTIASNGTNRKAITSNVSWSGVSSGQTSVATELTNWSASLTKSWSNPSQYGGVDVTGTIAGYKVATQGSYAYYVRNSATGPNFFIVNIATPTNPTVVGTLTLAGTPTNIAVNGNYAYVSNSSSTAEMQIVSVATPTAPTLSGTYNATGTAGGRGVYVVGNLAYLVRGANGGSDEFVVVNVATPSAPTRVTGYGLNVNMNEVYVNGTVAYIATSSDTQELLVINLLLSPILSLGTSVDLPGTTDATTIDGYGGSITIGQGTTLWTGNLLLALIPVVGGSVTMPGTINDVAVDTTHGYVDVGTNYANGEFQVVNANNLAAPTILSSVNMTGSINLTGVAYNTTYDVVPGASSNTAQEAVVFGPN